MVDLTKDCTKWMLVDFGRGQLLNISHEIKGLRKDSVVLDEDELKDIIKFCIEKGFLEWDCNECPIQ